MNPHARITWLATVAWLMAALGGGLLAAPDKSGTSKSAISLPSGPGSIEGLGDSFEAQLNTGTMTYGVGLTLPPGRAGTQPGVHLSYNGGAGNGLLGLGWDVGFGMIRRQLDKGFPAYNESDTFLLGGEELVPLSNVEGDWRCENEGGFQRTRRLPGSGGWEVTDPTGTRHFYGRFAGEGGRWSVVRHPSRSTGTDFDRTYLWALDATVDLHGNRIEYEYTPGVGMLYPSRITWSHWPDPTRPGFTNYHEVTFYYEDRPDVFDDFRATFPVRTEKRLHRVEVASFYDGSRHLVRAYEAEYSYRPEDFIQPPSDSTDLAVSLLKRVVQYGRLGGTNDFLPPLLLEYSPLRLSASELHTLDLPPELDLAEAGGSVQLSDIDGDGLPDLFQTTAFDQRFLLNQGVVARNGLAPTLTWGELQIRPRATDMQLSNPESALMDFDNDGLVDYVQLQDDILGGRSLTVFRNGSDLARHDAEVPGFLTASDVSFDLPALLSLTNAATRQMDLNFDKLTDFVTSEPDFIGQFRCVFRDADGRWQTTTTDYPNDLPNAFTFAWRGEPGQPATFLADMNGDRMQDLVLVEKDGPSLRVRYWPYVSLGVWGEAREMSVAAPDVLTLETADLRDVYIQDVNGDGLADLLMLDGSSDDSRLVLRVNLAGRAWSGPIERNGLPRFRPREVGVPTTVRFADLNGNGSVDILWVNPGLSPGWQWLELMPEGKPNLLRRADNSLGRVMEVTYTTTTEDMIRAREKGFPWQTRTPFPLPVIRRIRTTPGLDLDGVPDAGRSVSTDQYVSEFQYRDPYYDTIEREFRGFAFAQNIAWGDELLLDTNLTTFVKLPAWNQSRTPTGQVSSPTQVTRLRYLTGAPDGIDNDEYPAGASANARYVDEITPRGGREEEPLKGRQVWMETVDGWAMHDPLGGGDFDRGCWLAVSSTNAVERLRMTPDSYVYSRIRQDWKIRRLYRSAFPQPFTALVGDGRRSFTDEVLTPAGLFSTNTIPVTVLPESGRSVSWAVLTQMEEETIEANGLLQSALGHPARAPVMTRKRYDYDNYGNTILEEEDGIVSAGDYDDERFEHFTFALGGEALARWNLRCLAESTVTDENGVFVNRTRSYFDGEPYVGLPLGQMGARGLMNRSEQFVNGSDAVPPLEQISDRAGDPRQPLGKTLTNSRNRFDSSGNQIEWLDPLAQFPGFPTGHARLAKFDPKFNTLAIEERNVVGDGHPDVVLQAEYDHGFAQLVRSVDANGQVGTYHFDQFGRITRVVAPLDTDEFPTLIYEYLHADTQRGRVYRYDVDGILSVCAEERAVSRVVTRQREQHGKPGVYVSLKYTDGMGRTIALASEGDYPGHWVVLEATGISRRGVAVTTWHPYDVRYGKGDQDLPPFNVLWTSAGRPPLQDVAGHAVVNSTVRNDPNGRTIIHFQPPEDFAQLDAPRKLVRTFHLPFESWLMDENDNDPGSDHVGTPDVTRTDGLGRIYDHVEQPRLDDEGRPVADLHRWTTRYWFDLNDHLVRSRDSLGNETWFRYDGMGRLIYLNDPDRGAVWKTYDDGSNEIEGRDAKGQITRLTYDGMNRSLTEDFLDEASSEFSYGRKPDVRYHYDEPAGPMDMGDGTTATATNLRGKLAWVEDHTGEAHYSYDVRGREAWSLRRLPDWQPGVAGDRTNAPLTSFRMAYFYDADNRLVRRVFPDNDEYTYEYSSRNLQTALRGSLGPIVTDATFQPAGGMLSLRFGNGVVTRYEYDPRRRASVFETEGSPSGTPGRLLGYRYQRDASSLITSVEDTRPASSRGAGDLLRNTQRYTYDDLYRLTSVAYNHALPGQPATNGVIRYRYDRIGNLLEQSSDLAHSERGVSLTQLGTLSYGGMAGRTNRIGRLNPEPGPHALTQVSSGNRSLTYDANGNVRQLDGAKCIWDFKNRLVALDDPVVRSDYRYDYRGVRQLRQVTWKPQGPGATNRNFTVMYPFPDYEIREGGQPVKYALFSGRRVAKLTGSFSATARVQRLRLQPGWNLVSLEVTTTNLLGQLSTFTAGQPVFRYNSRTKAYVGVTGAEIVAGGEVLWVYSNRRAVVSVSGGVEAPRALTLNAGSQLVGANGLQAHSWVSTLPAGVLVWRYDATRGAWQPPEGVPDVGQAARPPPFLEVGEVVFLDLQISVTLPAPDPAKAVLFYHHDHVGSVALMTDALGRRVQESTYYPFGAKRVEERSLPGKEPYAFTGKEQDEESGFVCLGARYQLPGLARFLSVDPALALDPSARTGNPQGLNFYSYGLNNPITFVDPTGCEAQEGENNMSIASGGPNQSSEGRPQYQTPAPDPGSVPEVIPTLQALPSQGVLRMNVKPGVTVEIYAKAEGKLYTGLYVGIPKYVAVGYEKSIEGDTTGTAKTCDRVALVGASLRVNYTAYKKCSDGAPPKQYDVNVQNKPDYNKTKGTFQEAGRKPWEESTKNSRNNGQLTPRLVTQGKWSENAEGRLEGYVKVGGRILSEYELDTPVARFTGTADGTLSSFASKKGTVVSAGYDFVGQLDGGIFLKVPPQLNGLIQIPFAGNANVNIQVRVTVDLAVLAREHSSLSSLAKL